ncbi:MAG TPA: precorrin-3B synthase [Coleofasciculaceae cyanobacterium]
MEIASGRSVCPGLFYATPAQDGMLLRIRIPGGQLTSSQCQVVAEIADRAGIQVVQVTNRANLQLRSLQPLDAEALEQLQIAQLAAPVAEVDALRNIMTSPSAGLDRQERLDTRPWVAAWNEYLCGHPELGVLSAKFSVCLDGGGAIAVWDRPNDIALVADAEGAPGWWLYLSQGDRGDSPGATGIYVPLPHTLAVLAALAEVYRQGIVALQGEAPQPRPPRLRAVIQQWGLDGFLQAVEQVLGQVLCRQPGVLAVPGRTAAGRTARQIVPQTAPLGMQPQRQPGLFYCGVGLPLGQLTIAQLRGLGAIAATYGSGMIRLTPWQNLLMVDLPDRVVAAVQAAIEQLGLYHSADTVLGGLVACAGAGCAASATDTQADALAFAARAEQLQLDVPISIHLTGCEKSCAQHHPSDITCLGIRTSQQTAAYRIYLRGQHPFERELCAIDADKLPEMLERLLRVYQRDRLPAESFSEFSRRYEGLQLQSELQSVSE